MHCTKNELIAFTEEILDEKLHFLCSGGCSEKGKGKLVAMEYFCYFANSETVLKRFLQTVVVIEYWFLYERSIAC